LVLATEYTRFFEANFRSPPEASHTIDPETAKSVGRLDIHIGGGQSIMRGSLLLHIVARSGNFRMVPAVVGGLSSKALYWAKVNQDNVVTSHNERSRCSRAFSN
jgi:hypothetical protein